MYNLLVSGRGWAEGRDTLLRERVFEYTDEPVERRFKSGKEIDFSELLKHPALFLEESFGSKAQIARVGRILDVQSSGRDFAISYVFDGSLPTLTNTFLASIKSQLGINEFEFSRTHWALKNVDLFQVLLRNLQPHKRQPRVFRLSEHDVVDQSLISVMMPFDPTFRSVYRAITGVVHDMGMKCQRADEIWESGALIQGIVSLIERSRVVVADCSGRNPNVFYEVGIAHTMGKDVILITQSEADVPFDLRHLRYIKYLDNREGRRGLREKLKSRLESF